ncbi:hypothetical protein PEBR_17680 [Penicillium brasilianum]|uniref:PKS/mFAS DH domain-containing protein n=1 Tax=Penicillium brasilianum TaxID=104259 RepID=A0A1S9RP34_PENBI|nr:hypothetical protein PEBR_17680 [Penicillium brasilianum]
MISPVLFSDAVRSLLQFSVKVRGRFRQIDYTAAVEIGPHEALKGPVQQVMTDIHTNLASGPGLQGAWLSSGIAVESQFWHEPEITRAMRTRAYPRTDLLGSPFDPLNPLAPCWRNFLSISENPWLAQHKIQGSVLYPAAGMLIMVLEAAHQMHSNKGESRTLHGVEFKDVFFKRGLIVPDGDKSIETNLHRDAQNQDTEQSFNFTLFSTASSDSWAEHASGQFSFVYADDEKQFLSEQKTDWQLKLTEVERIKRLASSHVDVRLFYRNLSDVGLTYGNQFRNLTEASAGKDCAFGTVAIPDTKALMPYNFEFPHLIHPATLDSIFHLSFIATTSGGAPPSASVPVRLESMFISSDLPQGAGSLYKAATIGVTRSTRDRTSSFIISDVKLSNPKIIVKNFSSRDMEGTTTSADTSRVDYYLHDDQFTQLHWIEDPNLETRQIADFERWLRLKAQKDSSLSALLVDDAALPNLIHSFAPKPGCRHRLGRCAVLHRSKQDLVALKVGLDAAGIISDCHHTSEESDFEHVFQTLSTLSH